MRAIFILFLLALTGAANAQAMPPSQPCPTNLFQWVAPTTTAQGYYECVAAPTVPTYAPPPAYTPPVIYAPPPPIYYPPYYQRPPWDHPGGPPDHH